MKRGRLNSRENYIAPSRRGKNVKTILVIDDDEGIRQSLQLILETEGYTVNTAGNGKEGLELLTKNSSIGLILLDLMMPIMDGSAFVETVSRNLWLSKIPIIIMTAFGDQEERIKSIQTLRKPLDLDFLMALIQEKCR